MKSGYTVTNLITVLDKIIEVVNYHGSNEILNFGWSNRAQMIGFKDNDRIGCWRRKRIITKP